MARYAAGLAVAASLLVVLAIWGGHGDIAANIAFADVQEAIRHIETAIEVVDWTKTPWLNHRSLYRNDSEVLRMEWPNGIICLCDTKQRRELTLNPKQKTARAHDAWVSMGSMNIPGKFATPREFLANLADIEQIAVTRLDEREFDGRKLVGFVLPRNSYLKDAHMLCHVWVDPQTRLPVR